MFVHKLKQFQRTAVNAWTLNHFFSRHIGATSDSEPRSNIRIHIFNVANQITTSGAAAADHEKYSEGEIP